MKSMDLEKIKKGVSLILEGVGEEAASDRLRGDPGPGGGHVRRGALGHGPGTRPIS